MKEQKTILFFAWANFFIGVAFYFFQYALRASLSVLAPTLEHQLSITTLQFANVAAVYFYVFILMQLFSGVLIDKYGVRKMFILSASLCGIGAFLLGLAQHQNLLIVSRMLMGGGSAFSLVIALTIVKKQFNPKLVALLTGVTGCIGVLGAIAGDGLITLLHAVINWRVLMMSGGILCFGLVLLVLIAIPLNTENPNPLNKIAAQPRPMWPAILAAIKNKTLLLAFLIAGFLNICIDLIASTWGIPYLIHSYHYTPVTSELVNSMLFVGYGIGSIVLASATRFIQTNKIIQFACILSLVSLCFYTFGPKNPIIHGLFALSLGFSAGGTYAVFILVGNVAPARVVATVFSLTELSRHLVSALLIQLFGYLLELPRIHGLGIYTPPFLLVIILSGVAVILSFLLKQLSIKK